MAERKATVKKLPKRKTSAKQAATRAATANAKGAAATARPVKAKQATASKAPAKKAAPRAYLRREDLGAPVEVFFSRHPPEQRAILEALHALVKRAAPGARESIKWGMPCFELKGGFCSLYTAPSYVGINFLAPPEKLEDPDGRLEGSGKTMRHLEVRGAADLDEARILRWLKAAAAHHS